MSLFEDETGVKLIVIIIIIIITLHHIIDFGIHIEIVFSE